MRQTVCDGCGEPVTDTMAVGGDRDEQLVIVAVATGYYRKDAHWRDYHRRCARNRTVAEVFAMKGAVPL